jgi:hypothetical protein
MTLFAYGAKTDRGTVEIYQHWQFVKIESLKFETQLWEIWTGSCPHQDSIFRVYPKQSQRGFSTLSWTPRRGSRFLIGAWQCKKESSPC